MGLEQAADVLNDVVGEVTENIKDTVVEVGEFSANAIEELGPEGMEALENGDLKGVIECSDMSEEVKERANQIAESIRPDYMGLFKSGLKIIGGALETAGALATPGVQPVGFLGAASLVKGVSEFATQYKNLITNKNAAALANA